ncbi:MAG TPA: PRC-barrel domain-containing protein [Clostridia bacterium]|nr:PRC-barrel domain-containing protein [Clostridia bacterium]
MLIKASSLIGLKIISLRKGENLGEVNDVIYDPKNKKVRGLLLDEKGWFPEAKVIELKDIKNIGKDAVTVESAKVIKKASEIPDPVAGVSPTTAKLKKMNLVTESGTNLGKIADFTFDPETGAVDEFEITQGPIADLRYGRRQLAAADIIKVGVDNIIVAKSVEEKFKTQREKTTEGITKEIQSTYERFRPGGGKKEKEEK